MIYNVNLGKKAKIRKIKFIGDKKYKNRKLFRIIASEEDKFWKFISQNKLLNQSRIELDGRLLESYYKNKGYYNVKVESSFAELRILYAPRAAVFKIGLKRDLINGLPILTSSYIHVSRNKVFVFFSFDNKIVSLWFS